jgi:hypothetical protein
MTNITSLQSLFETAVEGSNSTKMNLLPPGLYSAQINKIGEPQFLGENKNVGFRVSFNILNPPSDDTFAPVSATIFLDLTPQMQLDMSEGKNVALGRLREALDQNKPNVPWKFSDMLGQLCKVQITHELNKKTGDLNAQVRRIFHKDYEENNA